MNKVNVDLICVNILGEQFTKLRVEELNYAIKNIRIKRVLLQEEFTSQIKTSLHKNKSANYTNVDICLEICFFEKLYYKSIELKSTKNNKIPGSSVQQINPNEWVIFIKHTKNTIEIVTGQYINSITSKMPFPDRSPRPEVGFKTLQDWNSEYREIKDNTINILIDINHQQKLNLLQDWQEVLVEDWIKILFSEAELKSNERWFNNALRKFIIKFIDRFNQLSELEQRQFIKKTTKNIR